MEIFLNFPGLYLRPLAGLALAAWLYLLLAHGRFWQTRQTAPPRSSATPRVVAVIPARNESAAVAQAVASLAAQRYAGEFSVVLVDDDSSDGTASIARSAATSDLLTVIPAAPLPAGWTGKLWALAEGVRHASAREPEYLLFTDADIVHHPGSVADLVARAESEHYALVSYMVKLACRTPAERLLVPAFVFFFFQLYPPAWIRNPRRTTAGAAGGCILIARRWLEAIGGIAAIRDALIDDCALAAAVKRRGGRVWLGLSAETRSIREYSTFGQVGLMISRSAFTQLRYSIWLLAAAVAGMILIYVIPPLLVLACRGETRVLALAAWLLMSVCYIPMLRFYGRPWVVEALLLPAVAVFYLGATVHSAISWWRGKGGEWKGRNQALKPH
jgi:hopene-associated glycosyltransferase HpnB